MLEVLSASGLCSSHDNFLKFPFAPHLICQYMVPGAPNCQDDKQSRQEEKDKVKNVEVHPGSFHKLLFLSLCQLHDHNKHLHNAIISQAELAPMSKISIIKTF